MVKKIEGIPSSPGYATGSAVVYKLPSLEDIPKYSIEANQLRDETSRMEAALRCASNELQTLRIHIAKEVGEQEASIFDAHLLFLADPTLQENLFRHIEKNRVNCEHAVWLEIEDFAAKLAKIENDYLQERLMDFKDVGIRLLKNLRSEMPGHPLSDVPENAIIVAEDFMPSDSMHMNRKHVAGIATERGGSTSHAAILARAMGIPCVVGLTELTQWAETGSPVLIDGSSGRVTINPTDWQKQQHKKKQRAYEDSVLYLSLKESRACRLKGGTPIVLTANINTSEDIGLVN